MESITVCPITNVLSTASVRVRLKADNATGLKEISEVAEKELNKINYALRVWLDL